ncbi:MAG: response regulator [Sulfurimonas sp.]|nr:response regulator [Sulfurimonas sp.]
MRLLIVEDDWIVAHFIADVAIEQNCEVVGVSHSYDEALQVIHSSKISCAILDINLKGARSGIDVAKVLKMKKIPYIFLTAYKDFETMQEAIELRPLSYLIKPVSQEDIVAALLIAKNSNKQTESFVYTVNNKGMIMKANEVIILPESERIVFIQLIKNYRNIVPHEVFFELLWENPDEISEGTLRNIIMKLRKKLDLQINNIKSIGYCLVPN